MEKDRDLSRSSFCLPIRVVLLAPPLVGALPEVGPRLVGQAGEHIKKKYGKNAILKGMNLEEGATARERNQTIGGHHA